MSDLKSLIRKYAIELGFCDIGFARVEPLGLEIDNYKKWLASGYNGSMSYLEKNIEKRSDVRNILPNAKTVIVTAYNYYTSFRHNNPESITVNTTSNVNKKGKISRYAWGKDYHNIILPKLESLARKIEQIIADKNNAIVNHSKIVSKCYVDTGPILEKIWAEKAGIGWQAKNSTIISKKFGSWIFLGIIITTAEFEQDKYVKDYCGKCTLCIEACPTGAIVKPKVIDSRNCISYWTIETKSDNDFPEKIKKNLNAWLFGCDICQDVCPWNHKLQISTNDESLYPRNYETSFSINVIMNMGKDEFTNRFRNSPLKRPKLEGLKRNAEALVQFYDNDNN